MCLLANILHLSPLLTYHSTTLKEIIKVYTNTCFAIELVWSTMEHLIINAMQLFNPVRKINPDQHPPWFNSDIRHYIKRLRTLRRRYKQHPTHHISCTINSLELALQDKINATKQSFEYNLFNSYATTNSSKIFKYLKSIRKYV